MERKEKVHLSGLNKLLPEAYVAHQETKTPRSAGRLVNLQPFLRQNNL
jgi:hypothetical protein